jgi:hypothetical protein
MHPVGLEYIVILNDPELRRTLIEQPERTGSARVSAQRDLRFKLVQALRSLASHVDRARALDLAGPRQPA